MIESTEEINRIIEANKYPSVRRRGRPKNITKDKMVVIKKIGRPPTTDYSIFDPRKSKLLNEKRDYPRQRLNLVIRYEVIHNDIKYLFATRPQMCKEFNLTTNIVVRLVQAHDNKNHGKQLSPSEQRMIEAYPKFQKLVILPVDRTKKIMTVIRCTNVNENVDSLSKIKLKVKSPSK